MATLGLILMLAGGYVLYEVWHSSTPSGGASA